jgi:hypothetical protein
MDHIFKMSGPDCENKVVGKKFLKLWSDELRFSAIQINTVRAVKIMFQ